MRKLLWLFIAAALIYTGYWFVGAKGAERGIAAWIDARGQEGWQAEVAEIRTAGYPMRFETVLRDISLADPHTGVAYSTPHFTIESASYAPTALSARFAREGVLSTPLQNIALTQKTAEATLFVDADPQLTLERATFELADVALQSSLGWGLTLEEGQAAMIRQTEAPLVFDVTFAARELAPSEGLLSMLDRDGLLADRFDHVDLRLAATFDTPWDISALEGPRPQPTHIDLQLLDLKWGELELQLAGDFDVGARGVAEGKVAVKARNWREMIELATAAGAIPADLERLALRAGQMLAGLNGNADTIDAELTMSGGTLMLGIIPIGPAPRFVIH